MNQDQRQDLKRVLAASHLVLGTELVDVDCIVQHHRVSRLHIALHLHRETVNLLPEQCQSTLLVWVNVIFAMS